MEFELHAIIWNTGKHSTFLVSCDYSVCDRGVMAAKARSSYVSNKRYSTRWTFSSLTVWWMSPWHGSMCDGANVFRNQSALWPVLWSQSVAGCAVQRDWSDPLRDLIRGLLLSNDAILGWLTSQLTRWCFISFFRVNVCLSSASKATSQGSLTTLSFIRVIYKRCPCAWLGISKHLAVHDWSHWSSQSSTNNMWPTTAVACCDHLQSNPLPSCWNVLAPEVNRRSAPGSECQYLTWIHFLIRHVKHPDKMRLTFLYM